jgi:hypothetical protein
VFVDAFFCALAAASPSAGGVSAGATAPSAVALPPSEVLEVSFAVPFAPALFANGFDFIASATSYEQLHGFASSENLVLTIFFFLGTILVTSVTFLSPLRTLSSESSIVSVIPNFFSSVLS